MEVDMFLLTTTLPISEGSVTDVATAVGLYCACIAVGVPIMWAVSEALGKLFNASEAKCAGVLGPVIGIMFWLFGWLPTIPVIKGGDRVELVANILFAAIAGLSTAFGATQLNDRLLKPRGIKLPIKKGANRG